MSSDPVKMEDHRNEESEGEERVISTSGGPICGRREHTDYGVTFFYFHRIPYAKPPLGPLRFLPPVSPDTWHDTLDATKPILPENHYEDVKYYWGVEDCLYLHVRTKTLEPKKKLPVMVWIGGTGYSFDFSAKLCSGHMTEEDVVFIQITYRIGAFGFLSVGETTAPGNCGLKDVVMGLQWIQKNIDAFGGDADNVTLFGSGSGGSMVHFMMLSPMATGLFHKAIIQSGSALHNWAITKNPVLATLYLAEELGIESKHPVEVVETLRTIPEIEILKTFSNIIISRAKKDGFPLYSLFRPCVENEFEGQPAFITKSPFKILQTGKFNKVPFIIGCNKMEGHIFKKFQNELGSSQCCDLYNQNLTSLIPSELCLEIPNVKNIGLRLMQFYVPGDRVKEETTEHYFQFLSDYHFLYYTNKCVKLHSQFDSTCPIYYYVFDYNGYWGFPEEMKIFLNVPAHVGEIPYLFQLKCIPLEGSRDSFRTRQKVIRLWTNFAKYGNPTPDENDDLLQVTWDPVTDKNKLKFLNIGSDLTKGCNPFYDRMSFWDNLLDETTFVRICKFFDRLAYSEPRNPE